MFILSQVLERWRRRKPSAAIFWRALDRDVSLDRGMRFIAFHLEILNPVRVNARRMAKQLHFGQRPGLSRHLLARLIKVIKVQVNVTANPNKFARL